MRELGGPILHIHYYAKEFLYSLTEMQTLTAQIHFQIHTLSFKACIKNIYLISSFPNREFLEHSYLTY